MKLKHMIIVIASLAFVSCGDWLNVIPQGQVEGDDLLINEKGYNAALNGVYYKLTSSILYGKDMSYGMMDVLAQYWDLSAKSKNKYYKMSGFDYQDPNAKNRINSVWETMYQGIAQANYIIKSLEQGRNNIKYSELIEGEAYGLRAFMHMELAFMFGPVIRTDADLDKKCIAYRTEFNVVAQEFESMRSVLAKAKQDLQKAAELLKNDPITENQRYGNGNSSMLDYNSVLERRGARMNIYGVKGLMMRLELAMLNKSGAYQIADELIRAAKETDLFYLMNYRGTASLIDKNLGCEMLLGFYKNDLWTVAKDVFGMEKGNTNDNFCITPAQYTIFLNDLYGRTPDGSGSDNRLRFWLAKTTTGGNFYNLMKLYETPYPGTVRLPYYPEVPILRLAEVYYVACETMIGVDNDKALGYLNDIRVSRNLPEMSGHYTDDEIMEYLMRDMRKDFIGEGRMFPIYKRIFREFYAKQGLVIAPAEDKYVFPIPDDEYEYSPNENPKGDK